MQPWAVRPLSEALPLPPGRWRVRALLALDGQASGVASRLLGWLSPAREAGAVAEPAGSGGLGHGQAGREDGDVLAVWQMQTQGMDAKALNPEPSHAAQHCSALLGWEVAAALLGGAPLTCLAGAPGAGFDALAGESAAAVPNEPGSCESKHLVWPLSTAGSQHRARTSGADQALALWPLHR